MADITLTATPLLDGADITIAENRIKERDDLAIVSIASPLGGDGALAAALKSGWSLELPGPISTTSSGDTRAVRTGQDQMLLVFPHATPDAEPYVQGKLNGAGYTTDQTDSWVTLDISGPQTLAALERICPLDLERFDTGDAGRTVMEHMGAMVIRLGDDRFLLLSASSSAQSFLHAVETSYKYVS